MRPIEEEIKEEIENGEFADKIKDKCSWCGKPIPKTIEWYIRNGCACQECLSGFNKGIEERKKLKQLKKQYEHK